MVGSIAITNLDRYLNSQCGFTCGYVIEKYTFFNPLDFILVEMSKYYPLDFILFATILFYMFITCLYGLVRLGIKFLCINVRFYTCVTISVVLNQEKANFTSSIELGFTPNYIHDVLIFNAIALNSTLIHYIWISKAVEWRGKRFLLRAYRCVDWEKIQISLLNQRSIPVKWQPLALSIIKSISQCLPSVFSTLAWAGLMSFSLHSSYSIVFLRSLRRTLSFQ